MSMVLFGRQISTSTMTMIIAYSIIIFAGLISSAISNVRNSSESCRNFVYNV